MASSHFQTSYQTKNQADTKNPHLQLGLLKTNVCVVLIKFHLSHFFVTHSYLKFY